MPKGKQVIFSCKHAYMAVQESHAECATLRLKRFSRASDPLFTAPVVKKDNGRPEVNQTLTDEAHISRTGF
jgi:hypothetical protein